MAKAEQNSLAGQGLDVIRSFDLRSALVAHVGYGPVEMVRLLLDAGTDINMANNKGWTLLHCVACASANGLPGGPEMLITLAAGQRGRPLPSRLRW
jgi:hypothetical protein